MSQKPSRVYELLIKTTPERLWQALTVGELTKDYYYGGRVESTWRKGDRYQFRDPEGQVGLFGEILEVNPPRKLVTTFQTAWDPQVDGAKPSVVTWQIEPLQDLCKLTFIHEDFDPAAFEAADIHSGWILILSGLKTLLETGKPMGMPSEDPASSEVSAVS